MVENFHLTSCTISTHHCQCFEKLTEEETELVNAGSVNIKYKKGEIICKQGGFVSQVMYVEKGLVKVYLDNGGSSLVLKIIPDGNMIGLASASEGSKTYQYSAMAYVDTEVRHIDIRVFRQLLQQNAKFANEVIDILSSNSIQIYGRFFCLTHKQAFGRLADIILCLSDRIFKNIEFELPLSRKDIGELCGMTPETVIRILKKFQEDGLVALEGKKIRLLDYGSLKRISETG